MNRDPVTIKDFAKAEIVDKAEKPYRSPEHIAELNRRRTQTPDKWYPIELKPGWQAYLQASGWLKLVFQNATVVTGKLTPQLAALRLYTDTILINGDIAADDWMGEAEELIQVFTDDKAISEASKND